MEIKLAIATARIMMMVDLVTFMLLMILIDTFGFYFFYGYEDSDAVYIDHFVASTRPANRTRGQEVRVGARNSPP